MIKIKNLQKVIDQKTVDALANMGRLPTYLTPDPFPKGNGRRGMVIESSDY